MTRDAHHHRAALRRFWRGIDWHVALMLGPRHRFSEAQWQQLKAVQAMSPSVATGALLQVLSLGLAVVFMLWSQIPGPTLLAIAALFELSTLLFLYWLYGIWKRPTMKQLYKTYGFFILCSAPLSAALKHWGIAHGMNAETRELMALALGAPLLIFCFAFWVVAMWRNEFMADWLQDQERAAQSRALSQQLATAQIQPHFLFNSLASLQHWVQHKDDRAAPLLNSLTSYLRATLPLFDRPFLSIADEALAVQHYLEVMQARLGDRLRFQLHISPEAAQAQLPPGLLLTLVENAVEHGIQTQLSGGEVQLHARLDAQGALQIQILDNGRGPAVELSFSADLVPDTPASLGKGLGLRNSWLRLQQAFGARASLSLRTREGGGCIASVCVQPA